MSLPVPTNNNGSGLKGSKDASQSMLSGEVNVDSIRALDKQIREQEEALRKLKRARNSLLNIYRLPPEVLGKVFFWNVTRKDDFEGLQKESHNFLYVCHYWFEVASRTPEIWSFWGNSIKDWARWHPYSGKTPLDLVLSSRDYDDYGCNYINDTAFNVLKDRASRDTIRRVHLKFEGTGPLERIISSLTPEREGVQSNRMQSFLLWNRGYIPLDLSNFLARYRFPELRRLELTSCKISSWDCLISRTGALTRLTLVDSFPTPTTPQLLSIFASNPALQEVYVSDLSAPEENNDTSFVCAALCHLKNFKLVGGPQPVFELLDRLDYPKTIEKLTITLSRCTLADIPRTIGPYLRDHIQRRHIPQSGLGLNLSCGHDIALSIGDVGGVVALTINFDRVPSEDRLEAAALELVANVPSKDVVYFRACDERATMGRIFNMYTQLPNLKMLDLELLWPPVVFLELNSDKDGGILPSLQHLIFRQRVNDDYWDPFMVFLARRVSSGRRLHTFKISCVGGVHSDVKEAIEEMVDEFEIDR